ncbi:hypothetical protein V2J09_008869 [Rumex salicifolius]
MKSCLYIPLGVMNVVFSQFGAYRGLQAVTLLIWLEASRQWKIKLIKFLIQLCFAQSKFDHSLFTWDSPKGLIIIIYRASFRTQLHKAFTIKDFGLVRYFLGFEISRTSRGVLVNQKKYISDLIQDVGQLDYKPPSFPLSKGLNLNIDQGEIMSDPESSRRLVGQLYLNMTRPYISCVVQHLSQYMAQPWDPYYNVTIHIV